MTIFMSICTMTTDFTIGSYCEFFVVVGERDREIKGTIEESQVSLV